MSVFCPQDADRDGVCLCPTCRKQGCCSEEPLFRRTHDYALQPAADVVARARVIKQEVYNSLISSDKRNETVDAIERYLRALADTRGWIMPREKLLFELDSRAIAWVCNLPIYNSDFRGSKVDVDLRWILETRLREANTTAAKKPEPGKLIVPPEYEAQRGIKREQYMLEFFAYATIGAADYDIGRLERELRSDSDCKRYTAERSGATYVRPPATGYVPMTVLPDLTGQPFDNLALAWIHTLRPSVVRVAHGEVPHDAQAWRVTVHLDAFGLIKEIDQEVEIGYGSGENLVMLTRARRTGEKPVAHGPVIGNTARLAEKVPALPEPPSTGGTASA